MNNEKPILQTNDYNGSEPTRICPHCKEEKALSDFGFRNMGNGEIRNQSWCKKCRSKNNDSSFPLEEHKYTSDEFGV